MAGTPEVIEVGLVPRLRADPGVEGARRPASRVDPLHLVHGAALGAFLIGLQGLLPTELGGDPMAALLATAGQLPETLPAALLISLALAVNLYGGALLMRLLSGEPYRSPGQAVLAGLAGAVLLDVVAMGVLAGLGLYRWPLLLLVLGAPVLLTPWARPLLLARPAPEDDPDLRWLVGVVIVSLIWSGPILLTLASPVVPYHDVPQNHVAPVEHLRVFGSLSALGIAPDPAYGPSRIVLGYQALLGLAVTTTGVPAVLGVAQFGLPLALLVAVAASAFARALGGPDAGRWALLLLPLSATFLRLSDSRAGVLVIPLVVLAMWLAIEPLGRDRLRRMVVLALTVAAAVFVHPLLGVYGAAFLAVAAALRPSAHAGHVWPALAIGAVLAAPQLALSASLLVPPWTVLLPIPLAVAAAYGAAALSTRLPLIEARALPALALATLGLVAIIVVVERPQSIAAIGRMIWRDNGYTVITAAAVPALLLLRRRGAELIAAAVITTVAIAAVAHMVPLDWALRPTIFAEAPKFVYLTPTLLALAAAAGIGALWARTGLPLAVRGSLIGVLLVFAAAPIGSTPTRAFSLGEHRWAESVSIAWRNAAQGALQGLPDWRRMIDRPQAELVAQLRADIAAGHIGATTPVLQVATDQAIWEATPLAVFTGAMVTSVTPDPDRSQHSVGGRLHAITELPEMLGPTYPYLVLEPADLEPGIRELIVRAGYSSTFANSRGEVFRLPAAP